MKKINQLISEEKLKPNPNRGLIQKLQQQLDRIIKNKQEGEDTTSKK
jgi:hypothetical protein|tara:strand:+ start:379 stop:519 length:141 start_codon:yes stop_codon:yes gene_type:complete